MNTRKSIVYAVACAFALASPFALAEKAAKQDAKAMQDLAQANMAEVEAGKLASQKAQSAEVKKFAQHMVDDHGKQLSELKQMAESKEVKLPGAPKSKNRSDVKKLQGMSGDEFDRAYMAQMVKDHGEALQLAQKTSKEAKDPDLRVAAQKAAPEIQEHLAMAKKIAGETGAKPK